MRTALAVLALALALAGCGSAAATSHGTAAPAAPAGGQVTAPASTASTAPDPAAIIRQAGAAIQTGDGYDLYGDRMATGIIHGPGCTGYCGEVLTVYTASSNAALEQLPVVAQPSDNAIIGGDRFIIEVTGVVNLNGPGTIYYVSPATIASRVHGTVIRTGS